MDFVEEDLSRKLPPSERINHTLLAINYGAILVLLLPVLIDWAMQPFGVSVVYQGPAQLSPPLPAQSVRALYGVEGLCGDARRLGPHGRRACARARRRRSPGRKTVLITGATGFIGSRLAASLSGAGATTSSR